MCVTARAGGRAPHEAKSILQLLRHWRTKSRCYDRILLPISRNAGERCTAPISRGASAAIYWCVL